MWKHLRRIYYDSLNEEFLPIYYNGTSRILLEKKEYKYPDLLKNNVIKHTFTHFNLNLKVMHITANLEQAPKRGEFLKPDDFDPNNLPTVMKKVWQSIKYWNQLFWSDIIKINILNQVNKNRKNNNNQNWIFSFQKIK